MSEMPPQQRPATVVVPNNGLDLGGLVATARAVNSIAGQVTQIEPYLVRVACGEGRTGVLYLDETKNRDLQKKLPLVGETLQVYVLDEDPKTRCCIVALKPPAADDVWEKLHQPGSILRGTVTQRTDKYIEVFFGKSTTGRIGQESFPSSEAFTEVASAQRTGSVIVCKVLGVYARQSKKLILGPLPDGS